MSITKDFIPGYYSVDTNGVVYSIERFDRLGRKHGGITLKPSLGKNGYLFVHIHHDGKIKRTSVHRIVALTFLPNPENKPQVNHINSTRNDNRVCNLEWATCSENNKHAFDFGMNKVKYGSDSSSAKLTYSQVVSIRKEYIPKKVTMLFLSKKYEISKGAIQAIIENKTWINEHNYK